MAGLSAAVRAASADPGLRIGLVSKGRLSDSATAWAQGGVAAVLDHTEAERGEVLDEPSLHAGDTLRAGAGLCDREAVDVLVHEGPARVRELAALGARFDRSDSGRWKLSREAGHSTARVVHAGGAATGAEVERALVEAARASVARIEEHCLALSLIVEGGRCCGVTTSAGDISARHILLATGGAGQLYQVTTNPEQATGDGLAMALRAGVAVADVEFVQFHPTALDVAGIVGPRPLLSEALRGEGAVLRDGSGRRFVDELQPRDVVAAAIAELGRAYLDVSPVEGFAERFPTLDAAARAAGLDPPSDWLPVAPAAHYLCGGVVSDLDGATTLPGLWVAGEVACTGVHGANRLASNSLLEGMVFAARCVEAVLAGRDGAEPTGVMRAVLEPDRPGGSALPVVRLPGLPPAATEGAGDPLQVRQALQRAMSEGAGVTRSESSLTEASRILGSLTATGEDANLLVVARAVVAAAAARTESRGGHRRSDHPRTDPALAVRFVQ